VLHTSEFCHEGRRNKNTAVAAFAAKKAARVGITKARAAAFYTAAQWQRQVTYAHGHNMKWRRGAWLETFAAAGAGHHCQSMPCQPQLPVLQQSGTSVIRLIHTRGGPMNTQQQLQQPVSSGFTHSPATATAAQLPGHCFDQDHQCRWTWPGCHTAGDDAACCQALPDLSAAAASFHAVAVFATASFLIRFCDLPCCGCWPQPLHWQMVLHSWHPCAAETAAVQMAAAENTGPLWPTCPGEQTADQALPPTPLDQGSLQVLREVRAKGKSRCW